MSALGQDKVVLHGGFGSSWLTDDGGANWRRIPGLGAVTNGEISISPEGEVYYTSGSAAFRLVEEQLDTDGDGQPDDVDLDDDNDGLEDTEEQQLGTNPLVADTDGDGQNDGDDLFPTESSHCFTSSVILPDRVLDSGTHQVQSTGNISTANQFVIGTDVTVELIAGQAIDLGPGFEANNGSQFHASIGTVSCAAR